MLIDTPELLDQVKPMLLACMDPCVDTETTGLSIYGNADRKRDVVIGIAFVRQCPMSLHIRKLAGTNSHHIAEGAFKSVARSLKAAVAIDGKHPDAIPSTKGVL